MDLVVIRRVVLGVLLLGMGGLLIELALLAHYEDLTQQIPLVLLAATILVILIDLLASSSVTRGLLQLSMVLMMGAGLLGMWFHFDGSREFQLEMDPSLAGFDLVWHVLRVKSPPPLSPGMMVQMGILGLGYAYLRRR